MTTFDNTKTAIDPAQLDELLEEIRRYLDAVETFRSEGREPCWRQEALS